MKAAVWVGALGALAVLACGRGRSADSGAQGGGAPDSSSGGGPVAGGGAHHDDPPGGDRCTRIALRLGGTNEAGFGDFDLHVTTVDATSGGVSLPVTGIPGEFFSLIGENATLLGFVDLPQGATSLDLRLALAGAHVVVNGQTLDLPGCTGTLTVPISLAALSRTLCHAVIQLDLPRSIAGGVFMPNFTLRF